MRQQLDELIDRVRDLASLVIRWSKLSAGVFAVGAVIASLVIAVPADTGFGWRFPGWWLIAALLFVPAVVLWWFSKNAAAMIANVSQWPGQLADVAEDGIGELVSVASSARTTVVERRGVLKLASGLWQLRSIASGMKSLAGSAAPIVATVSPASLAVTAVGAIAGGGVVLFAVVLVIARLIL